MAAELAVPVADHDNALSVAVPGSSALQTAQLGPMAVAESLASGLPAGLPAGHWQALCASVNVPAIAPDHVMAAETRVVQ